MQISTIPGIVIKGIYACLPDVRINNEEAGRPLFGDKIAHIVKATGIQYRYVASPGISSLDLCCNAADKLLTECEIDRKDIGAVICVTFTPELLLPNNAIGAQNRLRLSTDIAAYDINLACSGYAYGLWTASLICKAIGKSVLLLDGDIQTIYTSDKDKATALLLSDAGTATLISPDDSAAPWHFSFYSDGSRRTALYIPNGGSLNRLSKNDLEFKLKEDGSQRRNVDIEMDGLEIFRFAVQDTAKHIHDFLTEITRDPSNIDVFVPHQANIYMIKQLSKKIGFDANKLWISGDKYGNSASATIPVTLASKAGEWMSSHPLQSFLVSGFGGGVSISTALIEINDRAIFKIFGYDVNHGRHV